MITNNIEISVVIPLYACESCINELYHRLVLTLEGLGKSFEIIMVNDASPQGDWAVITYLAKQDDRVKAINLSRNFGQHSAITAGLDLVTGHWAVVMDGDLQDQPEEIPKLYQCAKQGYDIVLGRRRERQDVWHKTFLSSCFYRIFDYLAETRTDTAVANFSIASRQVIEVVKCYREQSRFYPNFLKQAGFNWSCVDVEHAPRPSGKTSYTVNKRLDLALDIIVAHSNKPLRVSIKLGFLVSLIALVYALYLVFRYYFGQRPPLGWTSVIVTIFFVGGMILANLGIIGLYIGKVFDETKARPLYIIKETINV